MSSGNLTATVNSRKNNKRRTSKDALARACGVVRPLSNGLATFEQLEPRQLMSVTVTGTFNTAGKSAIPVSSTDLINGLAPTATTYTPTFEGGPIANLNDGTTGAGTDDPSATTNAIFDRDASFTVDYHLDTAAHPNGYSLTEIDSITGHPDTRTNQTIDVQVQTVSHPGVWVSLSGGANFAYRPNSGSGSGKLALTDTTGTIANNVTDVRFVSVSSDTNGSQGAVFREFDVIGAATPANPAPGIPTGVTATAGFNKVILNWNTVAGAEGYNIYTSRSNGGPYNFLGNAGGNGYTDTTALPDGNPFYYVVTAVNPAGESANSAQVSATPPSAVLGFGDGLAATYYPSGGNTANFTGTPLHRIDGTVAFAWPDGTVTGVNSPDPTIPTDNFSSVWSGQVQAEFTENVTFYTDNDDGGRIYVNGVLIDNAWVDGGTGSPDTGSVYNTLGTVSLVAGQKYDIVVEQYEKAGGAGANLLWQSPFITRQVIPQSQLFSTTPTVDGAVGAGNDHVAQITWKAVGPDSDSYNILRSTTPGGPYSFVTTILKSGSTGTDPVDGRLTYSYTDTGLTNGQHYYYVLENTNWVGTSVDSAEINVLVNPAAPAAPTNLKAQSATTAINLTWDAPAFATTYTVLRSDTPGGPYTTTVASGLATTNYSDTTAIGGTPYYYVVTATNAQGTSPVSNESAMTLVTQINHTPNFAGLTDMTLNGGLTVGTSLIEPASPTAANRLLLTTNVNGQTRSSYSNSTFDISKFSASFDFQDNNGAGADGFTFAINAASNTVIGGGGGQMGYTGSGLQSAAVKFDLYNGISTTGLYLQGADTNDTAGTTTGGVSSNNGAIDMAPSGINLHVGHHFHVDLTYNGTTLYQTVTDLDPGGATFTTRYTVDLPTVIGSKVAYVGFTGATGGVAASQEIIDFKFGAVVQPVAPTGLTATPGNSQIQLNWAIVSGAETYNVYRSTVNGGPYTQVATGVGSNSYLDTGLTNGTVYYYVVTAVNSGGESGNSNQATTTSGLNTPAAPTGLAVKTSPTLNTSAVVTFNASLFADSYIVSRSTTTGGPYTQVGTPTTNSFTDTGLTPGTTYYYVVSAKNAAGTSANTAQVTYIAASGSVGFYFNNVPTDTTPRTPFIFWQGNPTTLASPAGQNYRIEGSALDYNYGSTATNGVGSPDANVSFDNFASIFQGKLIAPTTGTYSLISSSDDDGYLYVNGVLVSQDPGGHGGRDATAIRKLNLVAGQAYNFVFYQHEGGGGAEAHLRWITPTNSVSAVVPLANIQAIVETPADATGLTVVGDTQRFHLSWNDVSTSELHYTVERSTSPGFATIDKTVTLPINSNTYVDSDVALTPGTTYYYRVRATNYLGASANVTSTGVQLSPGTATGGAISGSVVGGITGNTNLTTEGTVDWVQYGRNVDESVSRKNVAPVIGNLTPLGINTTTGINGQFQLTGTPNTFTWTDGTAIPTQLNPLATGFQEQGTSSGFSLAIPAKTTDQTVKVYVGVNNAFGNFSARMSDGSSPAYTDSASIGSAATAYGVYTVTFHAGSPGQFLYIDWAFGGSGGGATPNLMAIEAVTLADTSSNIAPTSLKAKQEGTNARVTWNDNSAVETGYELQVSDNGGAFVDVAGAATLPAGTTQFIAPGVVVGHTYTYQVRALGTPNSAFSNQSTITAADFGGFTISSFPAVAPLITLNGTAITTGNRLRVTNNVGNQAGSAFTNTARDISHFTTEFDFQDTSVGADGFAFVIQPNDPTALGAGGGAMGYGNTNNTGDKSGIQNSAAVGFDIYNNINATGLFTNAFTPGDVATVVNPTGNDGINNDITMLANGPGGGIDLHSGRAMHVNLSYDGTTLIETVTDKTTGAQFKESYTVDLVSLMGTNFGYLGFTGGTGGATARQEVLNWVFNTTQKTVQTINNTSGTVTIKGDGAGNTKVWTDGHSTAGAADMTFNTANTDHIVLNANGASNIVIDNTLGNAMPFEALYPTTEGGVYISGGSAADTLSATGTTAGLVRILDGTINVTSDLNGASVITSGIKQDILSSTDAVVAITANAPSLVTAYPAAQAAAQAIDNLYGTKYLNFDAGVASGNKVTGLTITHPTAVVTNALVLTSGGDAPERDPTSYTLEGSNDGGATWTPIANGAVPAFTARTQDRLITFANTIAYSSYRLNFPTVFNPATANSMQITEIQFLNITNPALVNFNTSQTLSGLILGYGAGANLATSGVAGGNSIKVDGTHAFIETLTKLDLGNGGLIATAPDAATQTAIQTAIYNYIKAGRGTANFFGNNGIASSAAATAVNVNGLPYGVGIAGNNDGLGNPIRTVFLGQSVDANATLVRYTYDGDLNLDAQVNADDTSLLITGFNDATKPRIWNYGDLNYDGVINADDVSLFIAGFNSFSSASPLGSAVGGSDAGSDAGSDTGSAQTSFSTNSIDDGNSDDVMNGIDGSSSVL